MKRDLRFLPPTLDNKDSRFLVEARYSDLDEILIIEHEAQPSPWARGVFEKEFELPYSWIWILKDVNGVANAYLVFWVVHDEVHILNVVTSPSARRQGMARTLVEACIETAQAAEMTTITLEVRETNTAARALYEGTGFVQIGRRKKYYSDNGEDALVLALILEED